MNRKLFIIAFLVLFNACKQSEQQQTAQKNIAKDIPLYNKTPATSENKEPLFNPGIKNIPANIATFIPAGYSAIDTTSGDLNLDEYPDMILVLKNDHEDDSSEEKQNKQYNRLLLILTGQPDHTFKLVKKNDKAVAGKNDDGEDNDPFTGITIRNGYFSVEMGIAGGSQHWQQIVTFKYDKNKSDWFLYKNGFISYRFNDSSDPNAEALVKDVEETKTVKDFGIVPFEHYDIYRDEKN